MKLRKALAVETGTVLTFTGAGGKSTAMLCLGRELAAMGLSVIATTTTRLGLEQLDWFPAYLVDPDSAMLKRALGEHRLVLVIQRSDTSNAKAIGYTKEQVGRWRDHADVLLVEGDGSRGLPLKAPADHEPVIPEATTHLVVTLGIQILGQPLDSQHVHRADLVADLGDMTLGSAVTTAGLARLLFHAQGIARGAPAGIKPTILLNGADLAGGEENAEGKPRLDAVENLALRLGNAPQFTAALVGQIAQEPPILRFYGGSAVVVLAAGGSSRFGSPKQMLPWQGRPLLRHVVLQALAAPVRQVIVVLGAEYETVAPTLGGLPVTVVYNSHWQSGQSTSVHAGLAACAEDTQAVIFALADQPELPASLLVEQVQTHRKTRAAIVAPRYQGRRGNPVLFDRVCFPELRAVEGDQGGRGLFQKYSDQIAWIEAGSAVMRDIDSPDDLA